MNKISWNEGLSIVIEYLIMAFPHFYLFDQKFQWCWEQLGVCIVIEC